MDKSESEKAALWLEGLRAFRRHGREWLKLAVGFFLILAILDFAAFNQMHVLLEGLSKPLSKDPNEAMKLVVSIIKPGVAWLIVIELAIVVQGYYFTVFFSRREMPMGQPVLSVGRFFYSLAKVLQLILIYLGIGLVSGIALFVVKLVFAADETSVKIASAIVRVLTQGVVYYLVIRYFFVAVLAVNKIRPVLKTSWRLTNNNWWRLLWNILVVDFWISLFLGAVYLIALAASWLLQTGLHFDAGPMSPFCAIVGVSLALVFFMGVSMAYACTACRILIEEKRAADPLLP